MTALEEAAAAAAALEDEGDDTDATFAELLALELGEAMGEAAGCNAAAAIAAATVGGTARAGSSEASFLTVFTGLTLLAIRSLLSRAQIQQHAMMMIMMSNKPPPAIPPIRYHFSSFWLGVCWAMCSTGGKSVCGGRATGAGVGFETGTSSGATGSPGAMTARSSRTLLLLLNSVESSTLFND